MAYDYYQDPGYGYDGYGYDGYEEYDPSPPPAPDKDWVDPVKVNREYLKNIQKSSVHKGFEGLKEDGLFLFEVMARSVSLRTDVYEGLVSKDKPEKPFMISVKFLDTPFVEINEADTAISRRLSGEMKTNSVLADRKSFTNLFQTVYTVTGRHDSLLVEDEEDVTKTGGEGEARTESKNKDIVSESSKRKETPVENFDETNMEKTETIKIMKGRSVLLPMPGFSMIQKLQQYPLILKVTQRHVTEGYTEVEGEILATSFIRLPETFRKAVLMSCKPETVLPVVVVNTNSHKLTDLQGWEVGDAELTLVMTCYGKGAVNCVTELNDSHDYDHTFLLRHLKMRHVIAEESRAPAAVDPRLAKEIVKLGLFLPSQKTSSEILQHCLTSNLISTDEEDRKNNQNRRNCNWFHLLKKAYPPSSHSFDFESYMMEMDMEVAAMWRKHRHICRDLKNKEPVMIRRSLDEIFRDLRTIQTGVTGIETHNPFEELANPSVSMLSLKSFHSSTTPTGNFQK